MKKPQWLIIVYYVSQGWIRINKNSSTMHRGIAPHLCNEEIPPLIISLTLNWFTTWLLLLLVASSPSHSLHDVGCSVHFFSCIHKVLLIMTQHHFHLLHPYSLNLYSCLQLFPFMLSSPQLRRKSVTIGSSAVAQPSLHLSHLISCLWLGMWCGWLLNQFFSIVCSHFLSLGLLVCSLFS